MSRTYKKDTSTLQWCRRSLSLTLCKVPVLGTLLRCIRLCHYKYKKKIFNQPDFKMHSQALKCFQIAGNGLWYQEVYEIIGEIDKYNLDAFILKTQVRLLAEFIERSNLLSLYNLINTFSVLRTSSRLVLARFLNCWRWFWSLLL